MTELENIIEELNHYKELVRDILEYKIYRADCFVYECKQCKRTYCQDQYAKIPSEIKIYICDECEDTCCYKCNPNFLTERMCVQCDNTVAKCHKCVAKSNPKKNGFIIKCCSNTTFIF